MKTGESNMLSTCRAWFPAGNLLAIRDLLLENLGRTTEHMQVEELGLRESSLGKDVDR